MKRKSIAALCVLMASSFVLGACGSTSEPPKEGGTENKEEGKKEENKDDKKKTEILAASDPSKLPEVAKKRTDTLIVGTTNPKGTFNPIYADTSYDQNITHMIFDGLTSNDEEGNPTPNIAESWEISEDQKTYTFKLKKGVKFSNGEELKAEDVAFTYTAICDPKYDGARTDAVDKLVGYEEYNKGDAKEVSGIKVIDDYTISFTLKEVKAPAIYDFDYGIMPKSVYNFEKGGIQKLKDMFLKPVGAGPYKFVEFKQGQYVSFEKNKDYFKGEPKIPNVIFKVTNLKTALQELQAGNVDIDSVPANEQNLNMVKSAGFLDTQLYTKNGYGYIGFNLRDPRFEDKRVRQALTYGLDRKGFLKNYYQDYGVPTNSHGSLVSWASPDESKLNKYEYNPDKAKALLDEAGWKLNESTGIREKDGQQLKIRWMTYTDSKYVESLIPIVKENWKAIGVEVVPELMEFATLTQKVNDKREFDVYNMAWNLSIDPDPSEIFSKSQDVPGGFNGVGWHPDKSEELIKKGINTTDQEERKKIYQEWYELINEEAPYIFLGTSKESVVVSSRVKGLKMAPYKGLVSQIHELTLE